MIHFMACRCGYEEEVKPEQTDIGAVWRCPSCGEFTTRVRARDGRTEWVVLDQSFAESKRLWDEPESDLPTVDLTARIQSYLIRRGPIGDLS